MVTFSSFNALGTSIETTELTSGAVTKAKLSTEINNVWTLLETVTFSNDSTKTTSSLDAYNEYMLELDIAPDGNPETSNVYIRINGDTGNNYNQMFINNVTTTNQTSEAVAIIGQATNLYPLKGIVYISGSTTSTQANLMITPLVSYPPAGIKPLNCSHNIGVSSQLSTITFLMVGSTSPLVGTIKVYGK